MKNLNAFLVLSALLLFSGLDASAVQKFGRDTGVKKLECWTLLAPGATVWGNYTCSNCGSTASMAPKENGKPKCTNCGTERTNEKFRKPVTKGEGTAHVYVLDAIFKVRDGEKNFLGHCPSCDVSPLQVKRGANASQFACLSCDAELDSSLRIVDTGEEVHIVSQASPEVVPETLSSEVQPEVVLTEQTVAQAVSENSGSTGFGRNASTSSSVNKEQGNGQTIFGRNAPAGPLKDRIIRRIKQEVMSTRGRIIGAFAGLGLAATAGVVGYQPVVYEGVVSNINGTEIVISYGSDLKKTLVIDESQGEVDIEVDNGDRVWIHGRRWLPGTNGVEFESGDFR